MRPWSCITALLAFTAAFPGMRAQSNIDPAHSLSSSEVIGLLDWLPDERSGPVITQYCVSGFIYGSSVGWISLGSGKPANDCQYRNDSASDFGVNVSPAGELSGFAYGANIGWINFAAAGNPRIDWTTGQLSGSAWSANTGWLSLGDASQFVRIESLAPAPDTDGDGLPDAWEIQLAGNLTALSGSEDTDHDGGTNLQEFFAGTDPFDPSDFVGPIRLMVAASGSTLEFPTRVGYLYRIEQSTALGVGDWSPAQNLPVTGTGSAVSLLLSPGSNSRLFYRVAAYPPLTQLN